MKQKVYFLLKVVPLKNILEPRYYNYKRFKLPFIKSFVGLHGQDVMTYFATTDFFKRKPQELGTYFVFNSLRLMQYLKRKRPITTISQNYYLYLSKFLLVFLQKLFGTTILLNLKKGSNALVLKKISSRKFFYKYFRKFLQIDKRIIGVLYYSLLLKDASIFTSFLKTTLEPLNIKLHKKVLYGIKKLIRDLFKPVFTLLNVKGLYFSIKGKLGVSGNAKKRRYFFFFGTHSVTTRSLKMDCKFATVSTYTGVLGMNFIVFF